MNDNEAPFEQVHTEVPEHKHPEVPSDKRNPELHSWWIGGWISPILAAAFTAFWGLMIYSLIGERPTPWQYGVVPYVPAQSYLASKEPGAGAVPRQMPLPPKITGQSNAQTNRR